MAESVSVIVPIYKTEKYLRKCIDSIVNQTYRELEIILVDDGSPDTSGQICDEYASCDPRIKVVHKKNGGLSDARNAGLNICSGTYVMFCDSDDWIEPDTINIAVDEMKKSNAELVVWGYSADFVDTEERLENCSICLANEKIYVGNAEGLKSNNVMGLLGYAWNKLYRKSLLYKHSIMFEKGVSLVEDILFNAQVIKYCNLISIIDYAGTHYVQRKQVTLGNSIYNDYMELIFRAIEAKKSILLHFNSNTQISKTIISKNIIISLKAGILYITKKNELSYKSKNIRLKRMLEDKYVKLLLPQCKAKSPKEFFFLLLIKLKAIRIFLLFCSL